MAERDPKLLEMVERNAGLPPDRRIEFRVGIHLGDVVEESDGDLMGDGVNIAARLEGIADPGGVCLSEDAYRQVRDRIKEGFVDLGEKNLKNIARPVRVYAIKAGNADAISETDAPTPHKQGPPRLCPSLRQSRRRSTAGVFRRWFPKQRRDVNSRCGVLSTKDDVIRANRQMTRCDREARRAASSLLPRRAHESPLDDELNDFGAQPAMLGGHAADSDG
jgi:hypothetical protein